MDKSFMQEYMKDILFGADGELSFAEYEDAGNKISAFVESVIGRGFEIRQEDKLKYLGQQLFGNYFDMVFGEQLDEFMQQSDAQEAIDAIWDAVSELFAEGFNEQDIASLLENIPMTEWDQAVDKMANRLRESIMKNGKVDVLGLWGTDSKTGENTLSTMMWDDLDLGVLKLIDDMVAADVALDDIQMAMSTSRSVDEFVEKLHELSEANGIVTETTEEEVYSFKDLIKAANEGVKDIKALDAAIKTLENKEDIDYGDMLGLAEAHPELLTVIGDTEALLAALRNLRKEASEKQRNAWRDMILGDEKAMAGSKYAGNGFNTLGEYRASISNQEDLDAFDAEIEKMLDNWQKANEDAKKIAKEAKEEAKEAEKTFNDTAKEIDTLDKAIKNVAKNGSLDMSEILNIAKSHPEIMMFVDDADKMTEALKKLKKEAQDSTKTKLLTYMLDSEDFFKNSEYYNAEFNTMREYLNMLHDSAGGAGQWSEIWNAMQAAADAIVEGAEETESAAETWLEAQMEIVEANERANWAKSTGYVFQMEELQRALDSGDAKELLDTWESFDDKIKEGIADTYPDLVKSLYEVEKASKDIGESADGADKLNDRMQELGGTIDKMQRIQQAKYFKGTADALLKLEKGTISATDAYDVFYKECDKVTKASEEIADAQAKIASKTALEESDVNDLASLLGMTTDQVLNDFPGAVSVFNELIGAGGELRSMFELLNKEAFIRITGVSEADFSNITNGLLVIGDMADETIKLLEATGQWKVETMELNGEASVLENGAIVQKDLSGYQQVLKPTGNNPYKGRSGGAGTTKDTKNKTKTSSGGGGGGSKNKSDSGMTEVEKMLDIMSKIGDIQGAQQNWYQAQQKYYSQTGQLQGVIAYMQKEKESLEAHNGTLGGNIKRIEEYMNLKRAELESMSESDERYATVASDLDKLQKAHQNYTKQLIDNKTAIEALAEAMEEQRKKIRQMEIDVEEMIYKAIEDRERKAQDMLNAEIEMENKVLELIKRRYEKERDQIIETTNMKIESLQQERDLLDEQLRIRKEQAEEEDKMLKLQELEAKYQRIIADPTRAKEAQKIRTEIDELREEMAWDVAQKEVDAQKEAIDQQITSLEDYVEYVENYYEDLFEHPQKLIEEMRGIMQMTQEELIDWLKTNDEEYQKATENTQKSMVDGWTQTYNDMKGIVQTYWDEVHEIMARGDNYIINFLKQHSADYAKASRLQAEAYVDEWQKKLNDLRKAHQQVIAQIAGDYKVIPTVSTSGTGTGGGGGGGGGTPNPTDTGKNNTKHGYSFTMDNKKFQNEGYASVADAANAAASVMSNYFIGAPYTTAQIRALQQAANKTLKVYKHGGLADYTGPAWLDGTPQKPERILNPYQTKLFETMVQALERMSTISVPAMSNYSSLQSTGANPVSVGDIIVNVDNLDTDDDYEELAQKVSEVLMDRIGKTAVVGGLRIRSV